MKIQLGLKLLCDHCDLSPGFMPRDEDALIVFSNNDGGPAGVLYRLQKWFTKYQRIETKNMQESGCIEVDFREMESMYHYQQKVLDRIAVRVRENQPVNFSLSYSGRCEDFNEELWDESVPF